MSNDLTIGFWILVWAVPVIYAVTLHEVAHGVVAFYLGDETARDAGRLSINPLKHLDLLGSIVVPMFLFCFSGFIFGWAKPVPINEDNLNSSKHDMILVAGAGPVANLLMSLFWAVIMKMGLALLATSSEIGELLIYMGAAGIFFNAAVMLLNLLPLPPLDGGRILSGLLPDRFGQILSKVEPWGFIILIVMIITGFISKLVWPMMVLEMAIITHLVNTPVELFIDALRIILGEPDYI